MTYTQWLAANRLPATSQNAATWLATQAPPGTTIPNALRAQFGGQARTAGPQTVLGTPGQYGYGTQYHAPGAAYTPPPAPAAPAPQAAPAAAAPAAPLAPAYTAPDPLSDPNLQAIAAQIAGLPGTYNPQFAQAAAQAAGQLADYSDAPITPGQVHAGPWTTFTIPQPGQGGYDYRQAQAQTAHDYAGRGVYSGSQIDETQAEQRRALDLQAQNILQGWQGQQQGILGQAQGQLGQLGQGWGQGLSNWQQAQTGIAGQAGTPQSLAAAQQSLASAGSPSLQGIGSSIGSTPTTARTPAQAPPTTDWRRQVQTGLGTAARGVSGAASRLGKLGAGWGRA